MSFRSPAVDTPLTRVTEHWNSAQGYKKCAPLELDFIRCGVRVGERKVKTECHMEYSDFIECMTGAKQQERYRLMREERARQKRPNLPNPPDDAYIRPTS